MCVVFGHSDRVEERRVRGTAEVSVAVEATAVWSRLFLYEYLSIYVLEAT